MADQPRAETPPPAAATDAARRPYAAPRLMLFGSAVEMTAAGSGSKCEDNGTYVSDPEPGMSKCQWPFSGSGGVDWDEKQQRP